MKTTSKLSAMMLCLAAVVFGGRPAAAQKPQVASRVVEAVDETRTVRTPGNVHPLARAEFDRGAVAGSQPMTRMLLLLQRSAEQESALQQLMDAQQTKSSASFHSWLTPEQFGAQFGPSDADVQAVTDWLTRQGFQIAKVSAGRTTIEFSGTTAQVRNAFQTEIHRYAVNGHEFFANNSDPAIPSALGPVVRGVVALNNFPKYSHIHRVGTFQRDLATGQVKPLFTYTDSNGTFYGVGPADFAKIYNIPAGADGSGQSIAIVGQTNINIQDVRDFRTMFGLPANDPQIILNGPDPGVLGPNTFDCLGNPAGDEGEADLDVEWSGAVAPGATIKFVASQSTCSNPAQVTAGIDLSALYIIDNNIAPVMSESYGACESSLGTVGNGFYNLLWQQAAAEGITVAISSGDNGSAGCDPNTSVNANAASQGIAVNGLASTPYNVAVGGTEFDQAGIETTYWNASNANAPGSQLSVKSYIPEVPWDNSNCAAIFPTVCNSVSTSGDDITAASGGPSAKYSLPPWQVSLVTGSTFREIPDVSFFASNGFNFSFYIVCQSDINPNSSPCDLATSPTSGTHNFSGVGGTSGSTPAFAGIMALVNQKTGQRQGNANYVLYALAAKDTNYTTGKCAASTGSTPMATCVYNDITKGNNSMACVGGSPNCNNSAANGFGILTTGANVPAFKAVAGFDEATGLGSINVANLLNFWSTAIRTATTTALTGASGGTPSGHAFTATATVSPAPTGAAGTETVALNAYASNGTTILGALGPFTLTAGTASISTNLLPPGTASLRATYGGDATHSGSTSPSVAVAVSGSGQASKTVLSWVTQDAQGNPVLSTSSQSVSYGSPYTLQIAVTNTAGTSCTNPNVPSIQATPCAAGKITLTDNGSALNDYPNGPTQNATNQAVLNNQGIAEDQPVQLNAGSHSIVASYAGDPNYTASTSNALSVTISKAASVTGVLAQGSGNTFSFQATISTQSNGAGPTGTVNFNNGSIVLGTGTCTAGTTAISGVNNTAGFNAAAPGTAYCVVQVTNVNVASLYPPPTNQPKLPIGPFVLLALALALALVLTRWMPENRRRAYAYASLIAFALLATAIAGCGGGGGGGSGGKSRTINVVYPGDGNYATSTGSVSVTIP